MREKPRHVLWVDPGKLCGFAWYNFAMDRMTLAEYTGPECIRMVESLIFLTGVKLTVGCEKFIITTETAKKSQDANYHIEMQGMMRRAASLEYSTDGPKVFEFNNKQTPSMIKEFCPDRILKELGWWLPEGEGHAHDAARHIFNYLDQNRWLNEKQKKALLPT